MATGHEMGLDEASEAVSGILWAGGSTNWAEPVLTHCISLSLPQFLSFRKRFMFKGHS